MRGRETCRSMAWISALLAGMAGVVARTRWAMMQADGDQKQQTVPVIGYLPDYRWGQVDASVYDWLTDLIYFSIQPKPTGELDLGHLMPDVIRQLRALKAQRHIRVLVSM